MSDEREKIQDDEPERVAERVAEEVEEEDFEAHRLDLERADVPLTVLGALAADVVADAIVRGVRAAASVEGWPGLGK